MADAVRVLIPDDLSPSAVAILEEAGFKVDVRAGMTAAELAASIGTYHGLAVRSATRVTAAVLEKPGSLKIIGRAGVGVDNIDVAAAAARGILVVNTPSGNAAAAAELAVGLLFALARRIPQAAATMRRGVWEKKQFMGVELSGKTLGVVGLGNIGRQVASRAAGIGMHVVGHDPYLPAEIETTLHVEMIPLAELLRRSDFVTVHVPLATDTKNLFDAGALAQMKKGSYLVNASRGGVVNEAALHEALRAGHLAGAALDVFETEPPGLTPLIELENVIATPHLGASTREAQEKVAMELAETFVAYLKHGIVRSAVNPK